MRAAAHRFLPSPLCPAWRGEAAPGRSQTDVPVGHTGPYACWGLAVVLGLDRSRLRQTWSKTQVGQSQAPGVRCHGVTRQQLASSPLAFRRCVCVAGRGTCSSLEKMSDLGSWSKRSQWVFPAAFRDFTGHRLSRPSGSRKGSLGIPCAELTVAHSGWGGAGWGASHTSGQSKATCCVSPRL